MKKLLLNYFVTSLLLLLCGMTQAAGVARVTIEGEQVMTFGPTTNTAYSNPYKVIAVDINGDTIPDGTAGLFVTWDIEGFKTANDTEGQYCDSYGSFSSNGKEQPNTTFDLCDVPMNFYGRMTATVTYGGSTAKGELYVAALGDKSQPTGQLLPLAGYPKVFSTYPDQITGYNILKDTYAAKQDPIIGGWAVAGSDGGMSATLQKDADGTKYVRFSSTTAKKSHIMSTNMDAITSQVIYVSTLRFPTAGATMTLTQGYPMWQSKNFYNPVTVNYDGTNITINNVKLEKDGTAVTFAKNTWYNVVMSADKTTEKCYCLVYDTDGTLLGSAPVTAWTDSSNPTFFGIGMQNSVATGSVDIASVEAYVPAIDADSYSLTADKTTLSIPNGETAQLSASVSDTRGYEITQKATWSVVEQDMLSAVTITPSATDSHVATITPTADAGAGTATILVNIGGVTKTVELTLTSSAESIKFTESSASITIPFDASETVVRKYEAIVLDGNGADLGRNVTLAAYEKDGTTPLQNTSITFDAQSGTLTVTGAAQPTQVVITASGTNSDNEPIAKSLTVNIHGLAFDFGYTTDEGIAEGFTAVGASTTYNETDGYGITSGTPTARGAASATDATTDYLEGDMTFKVKVQKGVFYTVTVTYTGTLTTAYINSDLAGYTLGTHTSLATETYSIPATRDFIDLTIASGAIAKITITKQAPRQKRTKPVVHHIGDSTSANNGSWAYRLASLCNGGSYPDLTALCTFQNNGRGGRNLSTYYTQGLLANVLADIYPDDIVMFGNMGTNGMGNSFETDVNYYLDAAEALGAKIILNSYTPHGAVSNYASGYNSSTATFNSYRRDSYDNIIRSIAAKRATSDENYLGFVEIGKNADAIFNAYAKDYAANNYASADAAAQAIIACFTDHNHYSNGTLACDLMLNGYETTDAKGIVQQLIDILSQSSTPVTAPVAKSNAMKRVGIYDFLGRKVSDGLMITSSVADKLHSGLYIINGKKYMMR